MKNQRGRRSNENKGNRLMRGKTGRRDDVGTVREREDDEIFRRIGNVSVQGCVM